MTRRASARLVNQCSFKHSHTEAPIEALNVGVLNRLPRTDEQELDTSLVCPRIQELARELGAVIHHDLPRQPSREGKLLQPANFPECRNGRVHFDQRALTGEVVRQRQAAEAPHRHQGAPSIQCFRIIGLAMSRASEQDLPEIKVHLNLQSLVLSERRLTRVLRPYCFAGCFPADGCYGFGKLSGDLPPKYIQADQKMRIGLPA